MEPSELNSVHGSVLAPSGQNGAMHTKLARFHGLQLFAESKNMIKTYQSCTQPDSTPEGPHWTNTTVGPMRQTSSNRSTMQQLQLLFIVLRLKAYPPSTLPP